MSSASKSIATNLTRRFILFTIVLCMLIVNSARADVWIPMPPTLGPKPVQRGSEGELPPRMTAPAGPKEVPHVESLRSVLAMSGMEDRQWVWLEWLEMFGLAAFALVPADAPHTVP